MIGKPGAAVESRRRSLERLSQLVGPLVLVAAPLALGEVPIAATSALSLGAAVALGLLLAARRGRLRLTWASATAGAYSTALALQLLPLPLGLVDLLAPANAGLSTYVLELFPPVPRWRPLSLDVLATTREFVRALGFFCLILSLSQHNVEHRKLRKRTLAAVALGSVSVALVALGHAAVGTRRFLGEVLHNGEGLVTTVFNQNHLASVLNVGALVSLGFLLAARSTRLRVAWAVAASGTSIASALTGSRAGLVSFAVGLAAFSLLAVLRVRSEPRFRNRKLRRTLAVAVLGSGAIAAAAVFADGTIHKRNTPDLSVASLWESKGQPIALGAAMLSEHPLLGAGRGSFQLLHTRYLSDAAEYSFTHVESEPLQLAAELGAPLAILLCILLALSLWSVARAARRSWSEVGASAALAALLVHALVDFQLFYAAGWLLAGLLAVPHRRPRPGVDGFRLHPALAGIALAALLASTALLIRWSERYDRSRLAERIGGASSLEVASTEARQVLSFRLDVTALEQLAARQLEEQPRGVLPIVNRALHLHPTSGRLHLLAAEALAALGRTKQAILEYRTAAMLGVNTIDQLIRRLRNPDEVLAAIPSDTGRSIVAAKKLLRLRAYPLAQSVAARALENAPDDLQLLSVALSIADRQREDDRVAKLSTRLLQLEPRHVGALRSKARLLQRRGQPQAAVTVLSDAIAHDADEPHLRLDLARLLAQSDLGAAVALLERLPEFQSDAGRAAYLAERGRLHLRRRNFDEAKDDLRLAHRLAPKRKDIERLLAKVLLAAGNLVEAKAHLRALELAADQLRAEDKNGPERNGQSGDPKSETSEVPPK